MSDGRRQRDNKTPGERWGKLSDGGRDGGRDEASERWSEIESEPQFYLHWRTSDCKAVSINSHSLCRSLTHLHSWLLVHRCGTNLMRTLYCLWHSSGLSGPSSHEQNSWTVRLWGHNKAAKATIAGWITCRCRCYYQYCRQCENSTRQNVSFIWLNTI